MASGRAAVARTRLADDRACAARLRGHALPLGRGAKGWSRRLARRGRPRAVGRARPRPCSGGGSRLGGRAAYTLAAVAPERVGAIAALALPYQPRGAFYVPPFEQARAFWYQWLVCLEEGARAVAADPVGFARIQWNTWSPPGWFEHEEFERTARSFANPDWVAITLHAYRSRFLEGEVRDARYEPMARRLAEVEQVATPTLMIQGAADRCDEPAASADQERFSAGGYRRVVLEGVGHFPHREAPRTVAAAVDEHLRSADR